MKATNWIKIDEKPFKPGVFNSPHWITEYKNIPGEIKMFRSNTSLAYEVDKIAKAVCEPEADVISPEKRDYHRVH